MDRKRLFLLRNLTVYPTLWELLTANSRIQHAASEKRLFLLKNLTVYPTLWELLTANSRIQLAASEKSELRK